MNKKAKHNQRLRDRIDKSGWSVGFSLLYIHPDVAHQALQKAGLKVFRDDKHIFGPLKDTRKAMEVLAEAGDPMSASIIKNILDKK